MMEKMDFSILRVNERQALLTIVHEDEEMCQRWIELRHKNAVVQSLEPMHIHQFKHDAPIAKFTMYMITGTGEAGLEEALAKTTEALKAEERYIHKPESFVADWIQGFLRDAGWNLRLSNDQLQAWEKTIDDVLHTLRILNFTGGAPMCHISTEDVEDMSFPLSHIRSEFALRDLIDIPGDEEEQHA